jgi:hypothetical protein
MICYKDMAFCSAKKCTVKSCDRHYSSIPDTLTMDVAWCDFSENCEHIQHIVRKDTKKTHIASDKDRYNR